MKTNLKMFQNWWKNTTNERRANADVDIDSNLFLFQRQQRFDFFVLSSKTIKTMKSFNINLWSRTKKVHVEISSTSKQRKFMNKKKKRILIAYLFRKIEIQNRQVDFRRIRKIRKIRKICSIVVKIHDIIDRSRQNKIDDFWNHHFLNESFASNQ